MKYLLEVFWSDEDEGCIAVVPDLPGCSAFGRTHEQAVLEIGDATQAWIAACSTAGAGAGREGAPGGVRVPEVAPAALSLSPWCRYPATRLRMPVSRRGRRGRT